jgi:hypothetical protein
VYASAVADPTAIGRRLKRLREEREWTRRDVEAELIKLGEEPISPSTLEKWESGKAEPRATSVCPRSTTSRSTHLRTGGLMDTVITICVLAGSHAPTIIANSRSTTSRRRIAKLTG